MIRFTFLFFFYFFIISPVLLAQNIRILCTEPLYDFGFVRESGGRVVHTFYFENLGTDTAFIKQVSVTCGCTGSTILQKFIPPGKKGKLETSYDPIGRPGFFNKTVEVLFANDTIERKVLLILRGQVIQKEILPASSIDPTNWQLVIKPFLGEMDGPFDHRFLEHEDFQNFINDVTYEIDKEKLSHIQLEVFSFEEPFRNDWNLIYSACRQRIIAELKRRYYSEN